MYFGNRKSSNKDLWGDVWLCGGSKFRRHNGERQFSTAFEKQLNKEPGGKFGGKCEAGQRQSEIHSDAKMDSAISVLA